MASHFPIFFPLPILASTPFSLFFIDGMCQTQKQVRGQLARLENVREPIL